MVQSKLEISGILREKLDPETATDIMKWIEGIEFTAKKYAEVEPIIFRLDERIDETDGELRMLKKRLEGEPDEEKKLILMEQVARYTTRMSMLKKIRNGVKSEH